MDRAEFGEIVEDKIYFENDLLVLDEVFDRIYGVIWNYDLNCLSAHPVTEEGILDLGIGYDLFSDFKVIGKYEWQQ